MTNSVDFVSMGFHFTFGVVAAVGVMCIWFLVLYLIFQIGRLIFWFVTDKALRGLGWAIRRFKKHIKGRKKPTKTEQVNNNLYPEWKKEEVEKMIDLPVMKWKQATSAEPASAFCGIVTCKGTLEPDDITITIDGKKLNDNELNDIELIVKGDKDD